MEKKNKGQAHIVARPRLMLLLGEQLITDEVAAVSELVKNAYDADATNVDVLICNVSNPKIGYIVIKDNGHGMSLETILSSWLELGTSYKARDLERKVRYSEIKKRVYLGEKGLGRLAVHKLGNITELVTRRAGSNEEVKLVLDWSAFENNEQFLNEIPIEYEVMAPKVFKDPNYQSGTQITIKKIQRQWTKEMLVKAYRNLFAMKSPFVECSDFGINVLIEDKESSEIEIIKVEQLVEKATYKFEGVIDKNGVISYYYNFNRPDLNLSRQKRDVVDIRDPEVFSCDRKPICGPFKIRLYCWDLSPIDKRAVFGDTTTYKLFVKPNAGVKVFRDGFRVLPYGNPENDWLSMDRLRVEQRFETNISRGQVIGAIEISLASNPKLIDKTDREGLIDNDEFRDFHSLIRAAIKAFQTERYPDKHKVKELTGRLRDEKKTRTVFSQNMAMLSNSIVNNTEISADIKLQTNKLIDEARAALDTILAEHEQPLLVAASIGLTYMMPTHEIRRDLHETMKLLRNGITSKAFKEENSRPILSLLRQVDETVQGIGRLMAQTREEENFDLEDPIDDAIGLMRSRFKRNSVILEKEIRKKILVKGSERLITIMLLNFLDNSLYWLLRKKPNERRVKLIVDLMDENPILVVSDSGPGFIDSVHTVTLPFFTRKQNGMGLGLYIAERIAGMNGSHLVILEPDDLTGLLLGANIAVVFHKRSGCS